MEVGGLETIKEQVRDVRAGEEVVKDERRPRTEPRLLHVAADVVAFAGTAVAGLLVLAWLAQRAATARSGSAASTGRSPSIVRS